MDVNAGQWNVPIVPGASIDRELRERLICAALSGIAASCHPSYVGSAWDFSVADRAIAIADAVIARLERKEG